MRYKKKIGALLAAMMLCQSAAGIFPVQTAGAAVQDMLTVEAFAAKVRSSAAHDSGKEFFSEIVYDPQTGTLTRDGKNAGNSFGALSVRSGKLMLKTESTRKGIFAKANDGYTDFEKAAEKEGYQYTERDGKQVITNEFQTARLIVKAEGKISAHGGTVTAEGFNDLHIIQYDTPAEAYAAYKKYSADSAVIYVQPSHRVQLDPSELSGTGSADVTGTYNTWGAEKIGTEDFISDYLSDGNLPAVTVAVIDTGINAEPALFSGRILTDSINVSNSGDDTVTDDLGHGTHCTGTICELTPSNVQFLPVKVFDSEGSAADEQIYTGILFALSHGADILSMSFGGLGVSPLEIEAMHIADEAGIICCAAAGNNGDDAGYYYPGGIESCITVGAVDSSMKHADFSNTGELLDISAPGVKVLSYTIGGPDATETLSGTSMATPHVSACCALLRSYDPEMTPRRAESLLKVNAIDLGAAGFDDDFGWGLVNMKDFRFDQEGICYAPEFSRKAGNYGSPQTVELTTATPGASIYYSTDGSIPTPETGILYTEPLTISETVRLIAVAAKDGFQTSVPAEIAYSIGGLDVKNAYEAKDGVLLHYRGIRAELTVPDTLDGKPVTAIAADAFRDNLYLKTLTLPDTVTEIGDHAFANCPALKTVTAKSVSVIGAGAFENCNTLTEAAFGKQMKTIGEAAFSGCEKLKEISLPGVTDIPASAFENCVKLTKAEIPDAVSFGDRAFSGCSAVKEISCKWQNVRSIGNRSFADCAVWTGDLRLPLVPSLGEAAFSGDTRLLRVSLSPAVKEIPEACFAGCSGLRLLQLPGVTVLHDRALAVGSSSKSMTVELDFAALTAVGAEAFDGFRIAEYNQSVTFSSLTAMQPRSFAGALAGILAFPLVTTVPDEAFDGASVSGLYLEAAESLGSNALSGCKAAVLTDKLQTASENALPENFWVICPERLSVFSEREDIIYSEGPLLFGGGVSVTAEQHQNCTLRVPACGEALTYQWYNTDGETNTPISGETGATYLFPTDVTGEFNLLCIITDRAGRTEEALFTVTVQAPKKEPDAFPAEKTCYNDSDVHTQTVTVPADADCCFVSEGAVPVSGTLTDSKGVVLGSFVTDLSGRTVLQAKLKQGETYLLTFAARWKGLYSICMTETPVTTHSVADCTVTADAPESVAYGSEPKISVTVTAPDGTVLRENTDYTVSITPHNQIYRISVFGIGSYFGYAETEAVSCAKIPADTPVPLTLDSSSDTAVFLFVPSKTAKYHYYATPAAGFTAEKEAYFRSGSYSGTPRCANIRTACACTEHPDGTGEIYDENNYSAENGDFFYGTVALKAGMSYYFRCSTKENSAAYQLVITTERYDLRKADVKRYPILSYEEGIVQKPEIILTLGGKDLVPGKDYQTVHYNSDVPGKATALFVGCGLYFGTLEEQYDILPDDFVPSPDTPTLNLDESVRVTCADSRTEVYWFKADQAPNEYKSVRYRILNEKKQGGKIFCRLYQYQATGGRFSLLTPVKDEQNDYMLRNGTYCLVCLRQFVNAYTVANLSVIVPHSLTGAVITAPDEIYTGSEIEPQLTVTAADGAVLERDKDYIVKYPDDHILFGETKVVLRPTARSYGSATGSFNIYVDLSADAPLLETGSHEVQVTLDDRLALYKVNPEQDTTYVFSCDDVPNKVLRVFDADAELLAEEYGTGTKAVSFTVPAGESRYLMIKFNGTEREGTLHFVLDTELRLLSDCRIEAATQAYTGEPISPDVQFYDGYTLLEEGKDYKLRYTADDVNIGTATANYIGIGKYSGIVDVHYPIVKDNLFYNDEGTEYFAIMLGKSYSVKADDETDYPVFFYTAGTDCELKLEIFDSMSRLTVQHYGMDGEFTQSIFVKPNGEMSVWLKAGETCYFRFSSTDVSSWNRTFGFRLSDMIVDQYTVFRDTEYGVVYRINTETGYAEAYSLIPDAKQIVLLPELFAENGSYLQITTEPTDTPIPVSFISEGLFSSLPPDCVVYGFPGCPAAAYADKYGFAYLESANAGVVRGDLNGDGLCTDADAVLLLKINGEYDTLLLSEVQLSEADLNADGMIDLDDFAMIQTMIQPREEE